MGGNAPLTSMDFRSVAAETTSRNRRRESHFSNQKRTAPAHANGGSGKVFAAWSIFRNPPRLSAAKNPSRPPSPGLYVKSC